MRSRFLICRFIMFLTLTLTFSFSLKAVINGVPVEESDYGSVVCLYNEETGEICTGTFVSPTQVLTAAHCLGGDQNEELSPI